MMSFGSWEEKRDAWYIWYTVCYEVTEQEILKVELNVWLTQRDNLPEAELWGSQQ